MRILVEALCAEFGGIRTYVQNLLNTWPETFPTDDVHVLLREDSTLLVDGRITRHDATIPRPRTLGRPIAQTWHLPRLARDLSVDAVLATLPSTTVVRPRAPMAIVVYDLRHELRPHQFSRWSRALRAASYRWGYGLADGFVSISQRTLDDLHELHPRSARRPSVVAHLGADHVDSWQRASSVGPSVTFAHHTNKNLELLLNGWSQVVHIRPSARLIVFGLDGETRAKLEPRLAAMGLSANIELAGFAPDAEFQYKFASAQSIVFPSDFEGFGLPVAEGLRLGIPVVIGPEKATQEVAGGHAHVMVDWSPSALAAAVDNALDCSHTQLTAGREHANRYTWANTVYATRSLLTDLIATPDDESELD